MRKPYTSIILVACIVLATLPAHGQEPDPTATWLELVNQARLDEGLPPYSLSTHLTTAAQGHAEDLATHQIWSHTGSDGSTPRDRVAKAGYVAWTWNSGESIVSENFWTGFGTTDDAMAFFLEDEPHRKNILSTTYREIGIGVATDADARNYYVLDFGARPNVLPIFVNEGGANTDNAQVAITLTNEEARTEGQGANYMGQAIEIRISNTPNFDDQPWQRWEALVPWTLPDTPGEYTVYVQFRDAAGRTAGSADSIFLGEGAPATATAVAPTPVPPSPTPEPTATPLPEPSSGQDASGPTEGTPTLEPASTAPPPPTVAPTFPPPAPSPMPSSLSTTPFPTWTPLPTAAPPTKADTPDAPLGALVALQLIAIVLGLYLALQRRRDGQAGEPLPLDDGRAEGQRTSTG